MSTPEVDILVTPPDRIMPPFDEYEAYVLSPNEGLSKPLYLRVGPHRHVNGVWNAPLGSISVFIETEYSPFGKGDPLGEKEDAAFEVWIGKSTFDKQVFTDGHRYSISRNS